MRANGLLFQAILAPVSRIKALGTGGFWIVSYCTGPILSDARVDFPDQKS